MLFPIVSLEELVESAYDILFIYQAESYIEVFPSVFGLRGLFLVVRALQRWLCFHSVTACGPWLTNEHPWAILTW